MFFKEGLVFMSVTTTLWNFSVWSAPVGNSLFYFNPPPMIRATDAFGNINTIGLFDTGRSKWPLSDNLLRLAYQPRRSSNLPLNPTNDWYAPFYDRNFVEDLAIERLND